MSKASHTAQQYWDDRSVLFANYYKSPSLFDRVFRKAVYTRTAVALDTIRSFEAPTILDIGSGPGMNSITWLKNSNASHLTGIDFAESMIEFAKKAAQEAGVSDRCKFILGDFVKHDFGGETFDVSVAAGVFDYIEDAPSFLAKMASVSRKAFVASWPENGLRMALRRYRYTCPLYHYSESRLRELHKQVGIPEVQLVRTPGGWVSVARR